MTDRANTLRQLTALIGTMAAADAIAPDGSAERPFVLHINDPRAPAQPRPRPVNWNKPWYEKFKDLLERGPQYKLHGWEAGALETYAIIYAREGMLGKGEQEIIDRIWFAAFVTKIRNRTGP